MPRARWYGDKLKKAVESGEVSMELIDERVSNILRTLYVAECMDSDYQNPPESVFKSPEMKKLACELGLNSVVLLKNEGNVLPLDKQSIKKVAVIGPHANYGSHFIPNNGEQYTLYQVGGSANVKPEMEDMITPLEGIREYLGDAVQVVYAPGVYAEGGCGPIDSKYLVSEDGEPGLSATYFNDPDFNDKEREAVDSTVSFQWDKDPLVPEAGRPMGSKKKFSVRWDGQLKVPESREYTFELRFDGQASLFVDGKEVFTGRGNNDLWWQQVKLALEKGDHDIKLEYRKTSSKGIMKFWWDYENVEWTQKAVQLAKTSDAVLLFAGNTGNMEREGRDRFQGLELSPAQQRLIKAVAAANPRTAVVTFTAGVTMENWINEVPAVMQAMYPGEQAGHALAKLLFGEATPNGKLTVSIPKNVDQYPEGHWGRGLQSIEYKEGVFVGYRHFDEKKIEPQFPFGHGLSYTTFAYGEPDVSGEGTALKVSMDITNSGDRAGAEVVQLYIHDVESSVPRPPKELKAYKKIMLQPGETKTVTLNLDSRSFAFFDEKSEDWKVEPGQFELLIGSSSRDIRRKTTCTIN
jgi:beta-glucosidase